VGVAAVVLALSACSHNNGRDHLPEPAPNLTQSIVDAFNLVAPWGEGAAIDKQYTCSGADTAPAVSWTNTPARTKELVLVMTDTDAGDFVHWVLAGIGPDVTSTGAGTVPDGAVAALNDFTSAGYKGPCPTSGTHHYKLTIYALNRASGIRADQAGQDALATLAAITIKSATVTGTFAKS
jgi:Raf kinase inhibitor-like YbhB/YbcL family protein